MAKTKTVKFRVTMEVEMKMDCDDVVDLEEVEKMAFTAIRRNPPFILKQLKAKGWKVFMKSNNKSIAIV